MRTIRALAVLPFLCSGAPAQDHETLVFGIGRASCATWLADSQSEYEGSAWIMGFWTGANTWGESGLTGASTDAAGVIESVKVLCRKDPAMLLMTAVSKLYLKFKNEGR